MVNYADGKIYRIVCNTTGLTYYGSTVQSLYKRLYSHKKRKTCSSKIIIEADNYEIILVETFACKSKEELHARERFYIESNECVNKQIPTRTRKEWRDANKENHKEYYEAHKEQIKEYQKEWREDNKEQNKEYREANKEHIKEKHNEYYEANKEVLLAKHKEYCEANKEHIKEYKKEYYEAHKKTK